MNGPEHYRAAEKLLSSASFQTSHGAPGTRDGQPVDPVAHGSLLARAQIHATLALAAATALPADLSGTRERNEKAWRAVAGVPRPVDEKAS